MSEQQRLSERFGRFFTSETVRAHLSGLTASALEQLAEENLVLRVETADGKMLYPELQFDGKGQLVPGLSDILSILTPAAADEWTVLYWLTAPLDGFAGRTAIELLNGKAAEDAKAVLKLAQDSELAWLRTTGK